MGKKTILVVEDNVDNMTLITDILDSLGHEVAQAGDGQEGIDKAREVYPDLILMDLSMPRKDGWTATKEIREDDAIKGIPIIALTAHAMFGDKEKALEVGCNDYVSKPIKIDELIEKIKKYLPEN